MASEDEQHALELEGPAADQAEKEIGADYREFVKACDFAGIPPSDRQWRKWKRGVGLAFERSIFLAP
jgi:hypothetical protein